MPITGPTPADWIANKDQRRDEKMRMMMQMAMAAKQFQQEQQRYQSNLEHQNFMEQETMRRNDTYDQSVTQRDPRTEMQRNYDWLLKNDPNAAKNYMEKQTSTASENFDFDIDDWTSSDMDKVLGQPPGTTKSMHPRQRQMAFTAYQTKKNPKADTSIQQWQTPQGRQMAAIDEALQRYEQRRAPLVAAMNALPQRELDVPQGMKDAERNLNKIIAGLQQYRDTVAERELTPTEWQSYMALSAGQEAEPGAVDPVDEAANELAREYGIDPALFKSWYQSRFGKKAQGPAPAAGPSAGLRER